MKKIIWLSVNIMILLYLLYLSTKGTDWGMVFAFIMYAMTFPIGFVVPYIYIFIDKYTDINMVYFRESYPIMEGIILPWSLFLIVGYLQWFILIPKIKKWWKKRKLN